MAAAHVMPDASLKLDHARFVITVDPTRRIIQDGAIVVQGKRITHVGTAADLQAIPAERTIDASGCRVITGTTVVDQPEPWGLPSPLLSTEAALERTEQFIKTYDHRLDDRVRAWAMPFGTRSGSRALLSGAKRLADTYGTGLT